MRRKKYTDAQIIEIIREGERPNSNIGELCRRREISEATFYRWKQLYTGVDQSKAARLKQLEQENARLRKLMVERDLELDLVREELKKN